MKKQQEKDINVQVSTIINEMTGEEVRPEEVEKALNSSDNTTRKQRHILELLAGKNIPTESKRELLQRIRNEALLVNKNAPEKAMANETR